MDKTKTNDTSFFGHPRGLSTLFFTETWERFSYYGMRAILLFYMYYAVNKGGLGFSQSTAASVMSIYGSMVYLASVIGGYVGDRLLGSRKTVFIGGVLIMFGHIALSLPMGAPALFASIVLIVLGTGLLKPNVSQMVGALYGKEDIRRDAGFSIFIFGVNLGAFVAPLLVGWIGMSINFHLGFSLAAIGMFFGLLKYALDGSKYLGEESMSPSDPMKDEDRKTIFRNFGIGIGVFALVVILMSVLHALNVDNFVNLLSLIAIVTPVIYFIIMFNSKKVTEVERSRVWAYIPLFIAATIFWALEEQGSVVLAEFASDRTQLHFGWLHIQAPWFQSLNPLFIMLYMPFFAWLWVKLGSKQPSSPTKFMYGLIFTGVSFLFIALPGIISGTHVKANPLWLLGSWAIVEVGEMLISPIGLSVTTKLAPKVFMSQMLSMWFLADSAGQAVNAQIVKLYVGHEVPYFIWVGVVALAFAVVMFFLRPWITEKMEGIH